MTGLRADAADRLEHNVLRSAPRQPEPTRRSPFPDAERRVVHGARVVTCHLPGRPKPRLDLQVDAGPGSERPGREGAASVLLGVLARGAGGRDARAFALATERLGAVLSTGGEWESSRLTLEVPGGLEEPAADLLADVARRPTLAVDEVERVRAERVDARRSADKQPNARAELAARELLFADGRFRTARPGTVASVGAVEVDDVDGLHARRFTPATSRLYVVGDLSEVDVAGLAERVVDGWDAAPEGPDGSYASTPAPAERRVLVLDRPGSAQASVLLAAAGRPRSEVDDPTALRLANAVLGGTFGSRLNLRLREELGYTYGASSSFTLLRDAGMFGARWSVRTEAAVDAVVQAMATLRTYHEGGPTSDELEAVRARTLGSQALRHASVGGVTSVLQHIDRLGLPDDHVDRERERLLEVTVDSATAALRAELPVDDLLTVIVGDAAALVSGLRTADLGPVDVQPFDAQDRRDNSAVA